MSDDESGVPDEPFNGFNLPEYAREKGLTRIDDGDGLRFIRTYANSDVTIEVFWLPMKRQNYRAKLYDGVSADKEHLQDVNANCIGALQDGVEYLLRMLPSYRNPDQPASDMIDV